ncbi:hypothetical protein MUCCIDRAFT_113163 [Mucor lusitanicus CBS 277.49]|uniref:Delta(24(24(1)))-sterol reductase n=1 Tax=Mucor lusitanicus CBS 277.49 TaxID=747725 RepID=A0A168IA00_MUCCL|nr:hypothetical protein MUCCIDRAFT_113163 [Mucor lusitanicus CBS 277.49]
MSKDSLLEPPSSKKQQQPAGSNKTNKNGVPEFKQKVTKLDVKIDNQVKDEFGCYSHDARLSMPDVLLLGVCVEFHQGRLIYPSDLSQWKSWVAHEIWDKIKMGAYPSKWATQMYMGYVLFSFVLAYIMPGPVVEELPIPSLNGKKASVFRLSGLIDHFGELMTVAIIWGFVMSTLVYVISVAMNKTQRMAGNLFYDYFMGASLNPRIGKVDLKMWAEIRLPWPVLFYLSLSCLLKQYETYGKITAPAFFMVLAHFLYVNACQKGEEKPHYTADLMMAVSWGLITEF